jgi:hypothetical protein
VTRNREFVGDGKKLDGDDGSDGGVTGDDDEEDGDPDCSEFIKKLESATRETWKKKNSDFRSMKHAVLQTACIGKGKAIPLQAWSGNGGSRRLRLMDFKTIST